MRTALCLTDSCLQARSHAWIGYIAIGLAVVVCAAPASFAQNSRVLDHDKSARARTEAEGRPTHQISGSGPGVFVAEPIGKIWVDPELLDGEPSYVRRTKDSVGVTIVEVSTTPFMPVLAAGGEEFIARPDQPALW